MSCDAGFSVSLRDQVPGLNGNEKMSSAHSQTSLNVSWYRSGTVNSKSFVGKVLLRIKWKFELN